MSAIHNNPEVDAAARSGLDALIRRAAEEGASDVHLRADFPPRLRINGELLQVKGLLPTERALRAFLADMVGPEAIERFNRTLELDFAYRLEGVCRLRVNVFQERGHLSAALRLVRDRIPTPEEIGLPAAVQAVTDQDYGLLLVTGPTGSGKSTTLAALIERINTTRRCHVLTIEDHIEFHFEEKRAMISQREVDVDTRTFTAALRHTFRQDPDVVMIGEMRDPETIQTALTLAETGHLTFSTLHTNNAAQTVTRVIDVMPPERRDQVRGQLAMSLVAVVSQRLLPLKNKKGRIAAREIMICNTAIRNHIREGKLNQILSTMQMSVAEGMVTMGAAVQQLVDKGLVDAEVARRYMEEPREQTRSFGY